MPPPPPPSRPAAPGSARPPVQRPGTSAAGGRPVSSNWSFNPGEEKSINDGAFRNLPVGTENYLIKKVVFEPIPNSNPPENRIQFSLDHNGENDIYPVNLRVCSTDPVLVEMANKQLKGFCDACGVTAKLSPPILQQLFGDKWVTITATSKPDKKDPKIVRVNISRIDAPKYEEDDQIPMEDTPAEDVSPPEEEPAQEEAPTEDPPAEELVAEAPPPPPPAAAPAKGVKPWTAPKKPTPPANDEAP